MPSKVTALQKTKQTTARPKMFNADWKRIVFPVGLTLGTLAALWVVYQVGAGVWHQSRSQAVATAAQQLAMDIGNKLAALQRQVEAVVKSVAARDWSSPSIQIVESRALAELPGAKRVRITGPDIESLQPKPYPGLDYAALSLLLEAKKTGALTQPGLGLTQTADAHLSWAAPLAEVEEAGGEPILRGALLISYPLAVISDLFDASEAGSAYLDLRSHTEFTGETVTRNRGVLLASMDEVETLAVVGTRFRIGYHLAAPPFTTKLSGFQLGLVFVLGVAGAAAAVMLRYGIALFRPKPGVTASAEASATRRAEMAASVDEDLQSAMAFAEQLHERATVVASAVAPSIFRTYDIRGIVGKTLTADVAEQIGRAIGSEALDRTQSQIVVARDGRLSGPEMAEALIRGLTAAGIDVIDIGAVPTGTLYFATHYLGTGSGVMVTGSHNPPDHNGFKVMLADETLAADAIQGLYRRIAEGRLSKGAGGVQEMDVTEEYIERIASDVQVEEPLKVVVDCGNGIAGSLAPRVLEEIGCEVVPLYAEVDGTFPNHHPDPSVPDNLKDLIITVAKLDADLGVAFDGDGDRLGVVTKKGEIIYPDRLLMMFARDVLTRNPGAAIIYDVKCTGHLAKVILGHGGSPLMWKTGHSLIKAKMKETDAALAGEMSGHFFFKERWYGFDDGIYAAARLLEILASEPDGANAALEALPTSVSTPEIKVEMAEGEHYALVAKFQAKAEFEDARTTTIDGVRADFEDGWGLVRCSNTTACLVMRFDATTEDALARIQAVFKAQLLALKPDLALPF